MLQLMIELGFLWLQMHSGHQMYLKIFKNKCNNNIGNNNNKSFLLISLLYKFLKKITMEVYKSVSL